MPDQPKQKTATMTEAEIEAQIESDDLDDSYLEDENNFHPCDNCKCQDACFDYGCENQIKEELSKIEP